MNYRLLTLQLAVVALGAVLPGWSGAATLHVDGLDGATIHIDGDEMGRLPLSNAIELGQGLYILRVTHAGYQSYETAVNFLAPDAEISVSVELLPLERRIAVVSSLFLAGTGQLYLGRSKAGWSFMTLQLASVVWAIYAESEFESASTDYQRARSNYDSSITDEGIRAARSAMESAWSEVLSAEESRNIALWSILGVAVASAVEAWWSYGHLVTPQVESRTDAAGARELRLGLRGGF